MDGLVVDGRRPVGMAPLFTFVSVPMMDRRSLERRPAYAEHMRRVPAIVPSVVWRRPWFASPETPDDERGDPDGGQGHGGGQGQ